MTGLFFTGPSRPDPLNPPRKKVPDQLIHVYTFWMRETIPQSTDSTRQSATAIDRSSWPVWVGRVGDPEPKEDYSALTRSQRIALCWEATKQAWALSGKKLDESAFRRDSESFSRREC